MKPRPSIEFMRECLSYNKDTGICTWKHRPASHFVNVPHQQGWNKRFSGKEAGCRCFFGVVEYKTLSLCRQTLKLHRVIWAIVTGEWPAEIDHIDGDGCNNKWDNLKNVTRAENMKNKRRYKGRELPTGVYPTEDRKRFWAEIVSGSKRFHIGYFNTVSEAAEARKEAEIKHGFADRHGST